MIDKRTQIIEAAIHYFANKGYHETSIQEIADRVGIAKGSVYSYFRSKEDLLMSVYKHYYELIDAKVDEVSRDHNLSPREKLIKQIAVLFAELALTRDFLMMQMKEHGFSQLNESQQRLLHHMMAKSYRFFTQTMLDMFGEPIRPYALDCSAILQGIIAEYLKCMFLLHQELDNERTALFIVERIEDVATGLLHRKRDPVLKRTKLGDFIQAAGSSCLSLRDQILMQTRQVSKSNAIPLSDDLRGILQVIEREISKEKPAPLVLKGMLALLQHNQLAELATLCSLLEVYLER